MKENKDKSLEKHQQGGAETTHEGPVFVPTTDIYEKDDAILVRCDMPGVEQGEVDISLESNELTITGRQAVGQPEGYDLLSTEYDTGTFQRTFKVPQLIERDKITAKLHNGELEIELPKAAQARPHKIEITTGG